MSDPAKALAAVRFNYKVERPRATFDRLQDEILALSVLASAAYRAKTAEFQQYGFDRPPDPVLLGHDWEPLAAAILPRIARLADEMTFAVDLLPEGDEPPSPEPDDEPARPGDEIGGGTVP